MADQSSERSAGGKAVKVSGSSSTAKAYRLRSGKILADLGADVVKVGPRGDPLRRRGPFPEGKSNPEASGAFLYLNANKRGVAGSPPRQDREAFTGF